MLLCIAITASGCAAQYATAKPKVYHVVLCWLKEPGNAEARQQIIDVSKSFRSIPGVISVSAGNVIPSDRKIVDDSFDVGIILTFPDKAAMQAYLIHPGHKQGVHDIIKPLVKKIVVYDFAE